MKKKTYEKLKQDHAFPHCDPRVLHAPGECVYCDEEPLLQVSRERWYINFTGHYDQDKLRCPSEMKRSLASINQWPGNQATKESVAEPIIEELRDVLQSKL